MASWLCECALNEVLPLREHKEQSFQIKKHVSNRRVRDGYEHRTMTMAECAKQKETKQNESSVRRESAGRPDSGERSRRAFNRIRLCSRFLHSTGHEPNSQANGVIAAGICHTEYLPKNQHHRVMYPFYGYGSFMSATHTLTLSLSNWTTTELLNHRMKLIWWLFDFWS